jgi:hypothetical protein
LFDDGAPALTVKKTGKGDATWFGFLPGLSYLHPALPKRPVDRGATDDAFMHFLPTSFDAAVARNLQAVQDTPVHCSESLVETTVIESKHGTLIPLINWTGKPTKELTVTVTIPTPMTKVELASGRPVQVQRGAGKQIFTLALDVADALILR